MKSFGKAIIGRTGFVGTTLLNQTQFDIGYRSTDIHKIAGNTFSTLVCAGVSAKKWLANKDPEADWQSIEVLMSNLSTVRAAQVILISTVDVFDNPCGVDEKSDPDVGSPTPYGYHRRILEQFVSSTFESHVIIRLPGLVGPNLKKNVIFDLVSSNNVEFIDSRARYQFYPMVNLWSDIERAVELGNRLVHLTAEPLEVARLAKSCLGLELNQFQSSTPANYDFQTIFAREFGGRGHYQYSARESELAIRAYAQSLRSPSP